MFQPHQTRRTCTCCPYKGQHTCVEQRRQLLLALDMIRTDAGYAGRFHTLEVEPPEEGVLPRFNSSKIFFVTVASYFRYWLLMYIANRHYFESDTISLSSF